MHTEASWRVKRKDMRTVYRVDCDGGIIYVGETGHYDKRIKRHFNGKGSQVTRRFSPICVTKVCEVVDHKIAKKIEKEHTLELMKTYGFNRVRGGPWTNSLTVVPNGES